MFVFFQNSRSKDLIPNVMAFGGGTKINEFVKGGPYGKI